GLLQTVLAPFLLPRVPREESFRLERRAERRIDLDERASDPVPQRAGLAADAAAVQPGDHVEFFLAPDETERALHDHAVRPGREVVLERPSVEPVLAFARNEPDPNHSLFAATGSVRRGLRLRLRHPLLLRLLP